MGLLDDVASRVALRHALDHAVQNRAGPGSDGVTVAEFAANADSELTRLQEELVTGQYRPRAARQVRIPKSGGGYRALAVASVRDRVVQHALADALATSFDSALHPSAYAWRRGRSTKDALAVVDEALQAGREWVFRGDVEEFFDRIPAAMLLRALEELTGEPALVQVVAHLLAAGTLVGGQIFDPGRGTGQGSPLSPFLANLYLLPFDRAMEAAGVAAVRYGDDLCAPTFTRAEAESVGAVAAEALERLRLALNAKKVEVRHRGEGFVFLGFQFDASGRHPSARARRSLVRQVDALLEERPNDHHEDLEALLRGWVSYYGSLVSVELPAAVRAQAEAMTVGRAQDAQFGALPAAPSRVSSAAVTARESSEGEPIEATATVARSAEPSPREGAARWQEAAIRLAGAKGTRDEAAVRASTGAALGVPARDWGALVEPLSRFDGTAAAEALAALGRFGDASEVAGLERPSAPEARAGSPRGLPVHPEDSEERPRFTPQTGDAERLLELFGGAEHVFLRDLKVGERIERERVMSRPTTEHAKAHLVGTWWMGVYPLRANNSVRFAAVRVVVAAKARRGTVGIPEVVTEDARRIAAAVRAHGLTPVHSREPGRGWVVWVLFAEAATAARARTLLALVVRRAGAPAAGVTRELLPAQDTAKPDKPGTGVLLPLGLDPRTGERGWFCDEGLAPVLDPCAWLRGLRPDASAKVAEAVGVSRSLPIVASALARGAGREDAAAKTSTSGAAKAPQVVKPEPGSARAPAEVDKPAGPGTVALATSPFHELPRAQEVYVGCAVLRHFVDQVLRGGGLVTSERFLVAEMLGRLGDEAVPAVDAVFRHLDDWRPGMGARHTQRLYPHPTSCGRVRQWLPELTARVGCDCRFRVPPGAYPTPVLHALGAAQVPGMEQRVKDAATRGGLARAAVAAMNEGRKELGAKAVALCTRLADLRRQAKALERAITAAEAELDAVLDEAGDEPLETPSGTLRRVTEGGVRRFVLEV